VFTRNVEVKDLSKHKKPVKYVWGWQHSVMNLHYLEQTCFLWI